MALYNITVQFCDMVVCNPSKELYVNKINSQVPALYRGYLSQIFEKLLKGLFGRDDIRWIILFIMLLPPPPPISFALKNKVKEKRNFKDPFLFS